MCPHKPRLRFIITHVRFAQHELRMPLRRDVPWQIKQLHALARRVVNRRLAHDRRELSRDGSEYVGRREHTET
jgi:hypothetical protein